MGSPWGYTSGWRLNQRFPPALTGRLSQAGYIKSEKVWKCPVDHRVNADQYSYSYPVLGRMGVLPSQDCKQSPQFGWAHERKLASFDAAERCMVYGEENTDPAFYTYTINDTRFCNIDRFGPQHFGYRALGTFLDGHVEDFRAGDEPYYDRPYRDGRFVYGIGICP